MRHLFRWLWLGGAAATLTAALFVALTMGGIQDASRAAADLGELRAFAARIATAAAEGDAGRVDALAGARRDRAEAIQSSIAGVVGDDAAAAAFARIESRFGALEAAAALRPPPALAPLAGDVSTEVDGLLDLLAERRAAAVDSVRRLAAAGVVLTLVGAAIAVLASLIADRRMRELVAQEEAASQRYASLVSSMQNGILVMDEQGIISYCNRALADMLGYEPEELVGTSGTRLLPPGYERDLQEHHLRAMTRGELLPPTLTRRLARDRTLVDVVIAVTPILEGRRCVATLSEWRNVTQELALRERVGLEVAKGESILDAAPVPIVVINEQGIVIAANPAVADTFGWPPDDLIGRNVSVLMPEPFASHHDGFLRHYLLTGEASTDAGLPVVGRERPAFALHRDGHQFPISLRVAETRMPDGHRVFTGVAHDLTLRSDQETERLRLVENLLNDQRDMAVGTMVAGVAHDFNNLLTAVIGALDLEISTRGQSSRWLDHASAAARRATSVVRRLLHAVRPTASELQPVDVWEVVRETVELARETFDRRVTINVFRSTPLPVILADPARLEQALLNLLLNARDAVLERASDAPPGYIPEIRVAAGIAPRPGGGEYARVIVSDNGVGMTDEVRGRLFDPFFTTKAAGRGSGLGMTMVREIIREVDGAIRAESAPGVGSAITVDLPAISEGAGDAPPAAPGHARPHVLIIDDEAGVRDVLAAALEHHGYATLTAPGGEDGLELLRLRSDVQLVLLNLNMPGLPGWEVLARIREQLPLFPVIIMSGSVQRVDALRRGADGVLEKPFSIDDLIARVSAYLSPERRGGDAPVDREAPA